MTIAGVEPECDLNALIWRPWYWGLKSTPLLVYTEEQVREILIKLLVNMPIEDVDGLSTLKTIPDKSLIVEQSEKLVDEFMESVE